MWCNYIEIVEEREQIIHFPKKWKISNTEKNSNTLISKIGKPRNSSIFTLFGNMDANTKRDFLWSGLWYLLWQP